MIGSEARADFTVIGDHVNYTSRLCAIARADMMLLSENTYRAVSEKVRVRGPLIARVKGKEEEQKVYALEAVREEVAAGLLTNGGGSRR